MSIILKPLVILNRYRTHNIPLHGEFLRSAYLANVEAQYYGPNLAGIKSNIISYNPRLSIKKLLRKTKSNVIIIYRAGYKDMNWLNINQIMKVDVPVILIDVDFCYINPKNDFSSIVDLHLLRSPSDVKRSLCHAKDELIFSVNPDVYNYHNEENRKGICYTGSLCRLKCYSVRRKAASLLKADVIRTRRRRTGHVSSNRQAQFYNKHRAAITDSAGTFYHLNGKHFEIPACGAVLFTVGNNYVENYLPKNTYVKYKADCSDIQKLWDDVNTNWDIWSEKAIVAAKYVAKYHTHQQRWYDLIGKINKRLKTNFTITSIKKKKPKKKKRSCMIIAIRKEPSKKKRNYKIKMARKKPLK